MKEKGPNLAASHHQRLLQVARTTGQDFQQVLTRFAIERLLVRLAASQYADEFVLKGALLFAVWMDEPHRPTIDVDLLGHGPPDEDRLRRVFAELSEVRRDDDALAFDSDSIRVRRIREDAVYEGLRVELDVRLGKARIRVRVDVGFGDVVTPGPTLIEVPTLLQVSPLLMRGYPRETVVAEKMHAIVVLGIANSRMKDFFDVWYLSRRFAFDGAALTDAVRATFERRQTDLPKRTTPVALSDAFAADEAKSQQWNGFVRKAGLRVSPPPLPRLIAELGEFALPVLKTVAPGSTWPPCGPWRQSDHG